MKLILEPQEKDLLKKVLLSAKDKKIKLYLVGGILRDTLLNKTKENLDIDFALKKGAINFARKLAKEIKAGFVVLDKEHGAARLVKRIKEKSYTLDFTDFRGKDLEEDLRHRDFTINAMALELEKVFTGQDLDNLLIDPVHAREDLKRKLIKIAGPKAFDEDPLRILRAFSFFCIFDFDIDKETLRLAKLKKDKLSLVSFERVRDELFKILDTPRAFDCMLMLDKLKILEIIFPEIKPMYRLSQGPYHHLDIWKHTLETVRQLELLLNQMRNNQEIQDYLNVVISSGRRRIALIKLGAFLHDIGKPRARRRLGKKLIFHGHEKIGLEMAEDICRRLKLSNDELLALRKMIFCHLRPGYLAEHENITPRAAFRYFRDTASEAVSVLLISIADQRSTKGPLTTKESHLRHEKAVVALIKQYFKKKKEKKLPRLITGDDLIQKFKLKPSPLIGEILREVEESQGIGSINSTQEALKLARRIIKEHPHS